MRTNRNGGKRRGGKRNGPARRRRAVPVAVDRRAAGQAAVDAAVLAAGPSMLFDRLEDRQLMAAHVAGDATAYATIQAAVNAAPAGGTVTVDAGSYAETVTIAKPLTVRGAQAGVDARGNARRETGAESIVTGATTSGGVGMAFYVAANDVTIDGFTVQGETNQSLTQGAGMVIAPNVSGTHVLDNLVQNNVSGLFLANASPTDAAVIQHDVFRNNNNVGTNGGRGIYTDETISGGTLTNVTIDGNQFLNNRGSSGTTGLEAAVAFESGTNANSQTNLTITNNVFDNNGKAVLAFNATGMSIAGNVVTHTLDWYSGSLRFEGNDHNVTITGNNLFANTGPAVAVDTKGFPGDDSGFAVTGNNIYGNGTTSGGNFGVCVNGDVYDGTFDARNNYWGSATGPSGDGGGTGDSVYGVGHVVSGSHWAVTAGAGTELFTPFATAPVVSQDTAYWGLPAADGNRIQAEDFDEGGQGIAYNDTTAGNSGGQYRTTGVDIEATTDTGGGYDVGWTAAGEWLDYAVNLTQGGTYRLDFRVASVTAGATFRVLVDGQQVGTDTAVPATGGNQTWTTVSPSITSLTAGPHTVRVQFVNNNAGGTGPNFNWFQMVNTAPVASATAPTGLSAMAKGATEVALAWTNTTNPASAGAVKVQRSTDGVNYATVATLAVNAQSYVDTTAAPITTYSYRIVATNLGGDSAPSNVSTVTTAPAATTALTALAWTSATAGWSTPQANATINGKPITLRGTVYATGIGTHASSTITYSLAGRFGTFTSAVGIDDETGGQGAADFLVYGDGVLLYNSGVLTGASAAKTLSMNVTGVQTLTLVASPGVAGSIDYDHADWAGATLLTAAPVVTVPAAPTGLTAAAGSSSAVYLSWSNGTTNATGVAIDRSTDGGATWATVATLASTATAYTDAGLTAGTTYTYQVRATNSAGSSAASATAAATTLATTPVTTNLSTLTPTTATVGYGTLQTNASINGNTLTLRGTAYATGLGAHASSTITYSLGGRYTSFLSDVGIDDETRGQGSVDFQVIGDGRVLYDSGVLTGTSAVAHVAVNVTGVQTLTLQATNGVAGSIDYDHADWAGARLLAPAAAPTVPAAPTALTAAAGSSASVYLSWADTAGDQTGFAVDRSTDGGATWAAVATVGPTVTTYTDTGLSAGTTYAYRVRATNAVGSSAASNTATATTLAAATTTTYVSGLTPTTATVGWGTLQDNATIKGNAITLRGTTYASGLGVHASSTVTYALGGKYTTFLSDVGIDDETGGQGAADFQVYGDGVLLYDSGVLTGTSAAAHLSVNVTGVQTLTLVAGPGVAGTIDYDHADWAGARLVTAATSPGPGAMTATTAADTVVKAATVKATVASTKATRAAAAKAAAAAKRAAARAAAKARAVAKALAKAEARAAKLARKAAVRADVA